VRDVHAVADMHCGVISMVPGEVNFAVGDLDATSKVVFAPEGVTPLLGVVALENLALMLNPVTRELLPMRLFMARAS